MYATHENILYILVNGSVNDLMKVGESLKMKITVYWGCIIPLSV